jgi:hypothetical protein
MGEALREGVEGVSAERTTKLRIPAPKGIPIQLVAGYVERTHRHVSLLSASDQMDFESARTVGHRLKGTGTGYGLPAVTEGGRCIERAATDRDRAGLRRALVELSLYLQSVEVVSE